MRCTARAHGVRKLALPHELDVPAVSGFPLVGIGWSLADAGSPARPVGGCTLARSNTVLPCIAQTPVQSGSVGRRPCASTPTVATAQKSAAPARAQAVESRRVTDLTSLPIITPNRNEAGRLKPAPRTVSECGEATAVRCAGYGRPGRSESRPWPTCRRPRPWDDEGDDGVPRANVATSIAAPAVTSLPGEPWSPCNRRSSRARGSSSSRDTSRPVRGGGHAGDDGGTFRLGRSSCARLCRLNHPATDTRRKRRQRAATPRDVRHSSSIAAKKVVCRVGRRADSTGHRPRQYTAKAELS
jgi:hypothetical protein